MFKKTLSVLLAIVMVCGMIPLGVTGVFAAQTDTESVADGAGEQNDAIGDEDYPAFAIPGTTTAVFEQDGNKNLFFTVTAPESGMYKFYSTGSYDTVAELYDSDLETLAYNDDSNGYNFGFNYYFEAGNTYYLKLWLYGYYYGDDGKISVDLHAETLPPADSISISANSLIGIPGKSTSFSVDFLPDGSAEEKIIWTSSNESAASVNEYGQVSFIAPGEAEITATTPSGLTDSVTVKVVEAQTIYAGDIKEVQINNPGDIVFFEFTAEEEAQYTVFTPNADEKSKALRFYNEEMYSYSSYTGSNPHVNRNCTQGDKYYIWCSFGNSNATGTYEIKLIKSPEAEELVLSPSEISGYPGSETYISSQFLPQFAKSQDITWTTSDPDIVDLYAGYNYAYANLKKPGTATITATSENGLKTEIPVTVKDYEILAAGETKTAVIKAAGDSVTYIITADKDAAYRFTSNSNTYTRAYLYDEDMMEIAYDDDWEYSFEVQSILEAGKTYYLDVSFYNDITGSFTVSAETLPFAESMTISQGSELKAYPGTNFSFDTEFAPKGSYQENVTWSSSDPNVVSISNSGYASFKSVGTAVITATSERGLDASCTVTVVDYETLAAGETKTADIPNGGVIVYKITPNEDSRYSFTANGDYAPTLVLLDGEFEHIASTSYNSINQNLEGSKTYYLKLEFYSTAPGSVTVSAETVPNITELVITSPPNQTTYVKGFTDDIYFDGLKIRATWSDGVTTEWTYGNNRYMRGERVDTMTYENSVTVRCCEISDSFELTLIDNPVESIEVLNGIAPIIENTKGFWDTAYNPETEKYDIKYFCYDDFDTDNLQVKINYLDHTSVIANAGDKVNGYYVSLYSNQYDNHWAVGNDNEASVSYLGKTATLYVAIVESPVESIEVLGDLDPIVENSGGRPENRYNPDTDDYEEFYYYNNLGVYGLPVIIHYKDGTTEEAEIGEKINGYYINYTTDQYSKPFTLGSDNEVIITFMGCETTIYATVIESSVDRIEILGTPDPIIELTNGYTDTRYNPDTGENEQFFYYSDLELYSLAIRIYYKDGTTKDAEYGDWVDGNYFQYSTDQYNKPFTLGSDNPVTIEFMGAEAETYITITENPVQSLEVLNGFEMNLVENVDGYTDTRYNPDTGNYDLEFFRYYYDGIEKADILITFKDGTTKVMHPYAQYNGNTVRVIDDQSGQPFTVGEDNFFTVSYLGVSARVSVKLVPNPVKSIELLQTSKKEFIENTDGFFDTDEYGNEFFYYFVDEEDFTDALIKINYVDGTSKTAICTDVIDNHTVYFSASQYKKHWTLGSNNFLTIEYMGCSVEMPVNVIPTPISEITINSAPARVYIMGDTTYGSGDFFTPSDIAGLNFTAHFKDGTSKTYSYADAGQDRTFDGYTYMIKANGVQKLGENPVTFSYMGKEATYNVTVVENPVETLEVIKPPTNPVYSNYYTPDWRGMQVKLTKKDGSVFTVTLDDSNIIYGFNMNQGSYVGFMLDGYEAMIRAGATENGPGYFVRYLGINAPIDGLAYRDDKEVIDVSVDNFSVDAQGMVVKITNKDGSKEQITLDNIVDHRITWTPNYYSVRALTPKGVLLFSINNPERIPDSSYLMTIFGIDVPKKTAPDPDNPPADVLIGDLNGDKNVDVLDAVIVQKYAAEKTTLTPEQILIGDVNNDGACDTLDAVQIQKFASGKITEFKRKTV